MRKNFYVKYRTGLEENLLKAIRCFLIVCQIFCSAPVNVDFVRVDKDSSSTKKRNFKLCKIIIHSIWNIVVLICIITSTYFQHTEFDTTMGILQRALYVGEYAFGTLNVIIIVFGCHYQRANYSKFFHKFLEISLKLEQFDYKSNFRVVQVFFMRCIIIYTVFFTGVCFIDLMYNKLILKSFFRSSTVYIIPNIISILALTQMAGLLYFNQRMFRHLNDILIKLDGKYSMDSANEYMKLRKNILSILPTESVKIKNNGDDLEMAIDKLRISHRYLSILSEDINRSFGILIISTITSSFLILSIQFFAFYQIFESYISDNFYLLLYTIMWILLHGGKILLIVYPANGSIKEKLRTGQILYELEMNRNMLKPHIKQSIDRFSMQILHENKSQTACGIIDLDLTILSTITGALTTYLVILIQFDTSARQTTTEKSQITISQPE